MYRKFEIIHFVGIGGVGMSGIAEVLKNLGYEVRGSDLKETETTKRLRTLGIDVTIGHKAENVSGAHVVVVSSAVSQDNPEALSAKNQSIPVIPRAEMLAEIARLKQGVLIAGAHGKTTTTSLIASVLAAGGLDPTVIIGGKLKGIGSNARLGEGEFLVAEADESDGSFLKLSPTIAVVTNIDREHMDFFKNIDEVKTAFLAFINKVPFYGLSVLCMDNAYIREVMPEVQRRYITYGINEKADLAAKNIKTDGMKMRFEAVLKGASFGIFEVPLPGLHSVSNSLAAIAVAEELQLDMNIVRDALKNFSGVQRRFEFKGETSGIKVFDDYGHHPTEIMATLKAAKEAMLQNFKFQISNFKSQTKKGRLIVLFQPHRYSRTRDLLSDFFGAFADADKVILTDIYPAGERPINGINSDVLHKGIKAAGKDIEYIKDRTDILGYLKREVTAGDVLITLGAGDVWKVGEEFLKLKNKN
ncbi:MAG: UDP-N-acetylmuramate--L-alanine ligase [Nitrospirae bacterium]|nr:UDP-N-acetylmuramate--L-alanine ligase [Nitrospirota bacterium]